MAKRPGAEIVQRFDGQVPTGPVVAVVYDGPKTSELAVYLTLRDKLVMIESQTSTRGGLRIVETPTPFTDPWGEGLPTFVYAQRAPGADVNKLVVARYKRPYFARAGSFSEGALVDVDGDKRLEIVSRNRPLGRYFAAECGKVSVTPSQAFDTEVHFFRKGAFVADAKKGAPYLRRRLKEDEEALEEADESRSDDPSGFLGKALTVYFGRKRLGRPAEAQEVLDRALRPPPISPPGLAECLDAVKAQLREKLGGG